MAKLSKSPENRQRIDRQKVLIEALRSGKEQIESVRKQELAMDAKNADHSAKASAQMAELVQEVARIRNEVTAPINAEIEALASKITDFAKEHSETAQTEARAEAAVVERTSLIAGVTMALLLIGTCVFSVFTIARPMRALSASMEELAAGNFGVVLPGLGRKDEVGDMAQAVETFKVKAEEKAREEAEAKIKQDEVAAAAAQGRHDQARRRFRGRGRRDHRNGVVGLDRARSFGRHADRDRGTLAGTDHHGGGGFRGSFHQRAVGGVGDRRDGLVGQRDQPPGAGIGAHRQRSGRARRARPTTGSANCRRRRAASATWSN